MACAKPRILSISSDLILFESRNRVLESAGFEVVGSFQGHGALDKFKNEHFDVVVIGDSLSGETRLHFLRKLKQVKPNIPVVVVHQTGDSGQDVIEADASFESLDGPERLINTISVLIGFSPNSRKQSLCRGASAG
jgi:DNA-binding NarL/FixJ family response regulator